MTVEQPAPSNAARFLIRIYLLIATVGAVISAPLLLFLGWIAWAFTKAEWPGNWVGWAFYVLFSLVLVAGPFVGRALYKRGRTAWALAVSGMAFVLAPLIVAAMIFGG